MAHRNEAVDNHDYPPESNSIDRYSDEETMSPPLIHSLAFHDRVKTPHSLSPEKALIHLMKGMMGTGLLSLPLAFKHAGLWAGFGLLVIICCISLYCMRQVVLGANYVCSRTGRESVDYANAMRSAVEFGPPWLSRHGYIAKQAVNAIMFINQLGICCVYFVFMADNLRQFFDETSYIRISQAGWIALLLIPILALCSIRHLSELAPLALLSNIVYVCGVGFIAVYLTTDPLASSSLPAVGNWQSMPLFFGTVIFAFEGVAIILPIENSMDQPKYFISNTGVLNTACWLTMILFQGVGFFGYLKFGDKILDTVTLNLPSSWFYQTIKLMFVFCVMISYPIQFYAPIERVEKWISRKVHIEKQVYYVYGSRFGLVLLTCALAELIPHLALFISLVGAFAGSSLALLFPPILDLLVSHAKGTLTFKTWALNIFLMLFALIGLCTGTYASLVEIVKAFGQADPV